MTYCEDLNKVLIRIRIRIFFFFNFIFPVQTRYKFSRRVKNAARLGVADETSRGLFVFFQRAFLAEVVFAPATSKRFSISVNFKFCRLPLIGAKFKTIRLVHADVTYFVTIGSVKLSLQITHLNGKSSSSESISYFLSSSSSSPYLPSAHSRSNCQPCL